MRIVLVLATVVLTGCNYGFTFHPEQMTPDQMLKRADLVFIGVIEGQHFDSWPFFRVQDPSGNPTWWRPLRRQVRVETVLRGSYSRQKIEVYEIFWGGGATGDWNNTQENRRYLFMVRNENSRCQIVRDWRRSIYEVNSGYHARLPLDDSRPFWERYALMNYWIGADQKGFYSMLMHHMNPGGKLEFWREVKLQRGLLSHPQRKVRLAACWQLTLLGGTQDECVNAFSDADWKDVGNAGMRIPPTHKWDANREKRMRDEFNWYLFWQSPPPGYPRDSSSSMDRLRLFTTIDHPVLRREFCRKFMAKFPNDADNGCPADKPPPATIVTENGDIALVGPWPN